MRRFLVALASIGLASFATALVSNTATAAPTSQKNWTVMVYINGNNSLDSFGAENINQMEQVGSTDQMNVVVQWASMARKDTQRILVKKDSDTQNVTSPVVQDVGNVDMGDYNSLVDFAKWAITNYPAQHYLLDVWDHGSGWHQIDLMFGAKRSPNHNFDISLDENTGHWITTAQLGTAVGQIATFLGRPLDVYASDACMMQMAEVAGEMVGSVNVFAGSEETEPGDGWSYADFLNLLIANPAASANDVGTYLEKSYLAAYNGGLYGNQDVTFAAIDMTAFPTFEAGVKKFGAAIETLSAADAAKVVTAIGGSQAFTYPDYVDVSDFLTTLAPANITALGDDATVPLKTALASLILGGGGTGSYGKAKGLSMWIPNSADTYSQYIAAYSQLKFDASTGWSAALKKVLGAN